MNKPKYCFDPKCLEVAEHFLPSDASDQLKNELAQAVQNAVEEFCEMEAEGLSPKAWRPTTDKSVV